MPPQWASRIAGELERVGDRRTGDARHDVMTGAEEQVARLVAAGLRNREVAAELFMSLKTVESHLTRVYRKLGVRSRTELGAVLARRGSSDRMNGAVRRRGPGRSGPAGA